MDELTLANWMMQEAAKVRDLANQLREHMATVPSTNRAAWIHELGNRFEHLTAHMRRIMSIEEEDGYLTPVLERRPRLGPRVEQLRHEHDELRRLTDDLHKSVHALRPEDQLLTRDVCARIQTYLAHVQQHEEHENHIVLYTLTQEHGITDGS